jgi:hypothetical protein
MKRKGTEVLAPEIFFTMKTEGSDENNRTWRTGLGVLHPKRKQSYTTQLPVPHKKNVTPSTCTALTSAFISLKIATNADMQQRTTTLPFLTCPASPSHIQKLPTLQLAVPRSPVSLPTIHFTNPHPSH